ncbi:MAG: hypothetical protein M1839_005752 [Geoglossum umbratile]|nr:MAG: hypothetical protein M1839_005752 [Geoglossum umbratile]
MGDTDGMLQTPGVTERFSPPSSLEYPFDDSSQTLEVYDSNLRGSPPPTGETLGTSNVSFTDSAQYKTRISAANTPSRGQFGEITCQTNQAAGRTLAAVDSQLHIMDEDYVGGQSTEPTHVIAQSTTTDAADDSTKKRKLRVRIPKPSETIGPVKRKLAPHLLEYDATGKPKPFVRPPFPERVQDRSPIVGLSSKTLLRTCFRVGEALRAGSHAGRWGQDAIIELYARVVFSSRDGWKQHFQFADLFHDRPPFLSGTYEIFHGTNLWERDSARFLAEDGSGKMCRCIGRMRRAGADWKLVVLNIWEAAWDDVAWAKGIACA